MFLHSLGDVEKSRSEPQMKVHNRSLSADMSNLYLHFPISRALPATDTKASAAHCPCPLKH